MYIIRPNTPLTLHTMLRIRSPTLKVFSCFTYALLRMKLVRIPAPSVL